MHRYVLHCSVSQLLSCRDFPTKINYKIVTKKLLQKTVDKIPKIICSPPNSLCSQLAYNSTICLSCEQNRWLKSPCWDPKSLESWMGYESLFECHLLTDNNALWMKCWHKLQSSSFSFHHHVSFSTRQEYLAMNKFAHTLQATKSIKITKNLSKSLPSPSLTRSFVYLLNRIKLDRNWNES